MYICWLLCKRSRDHHIDLPLAKYFDLLKSFHFDFKQKTISRFVYTKIWCWTREQEQRIKVLNWKLFVYDLVTKTKIKQIKYTLLLFERRILRTIEWQWYVLMLNVTNNNNCLFSHWNRAKQMWFVWFACVHLLLYARFANVYVTKSSTWEWSSYWQKVHQSKDQKRQTKIACHIVNTVHGNVQRAVSFIADYIHTSEMSFENTYAKWKIIFMENFVKIVLVKKFYYMKTDS